jgi:hypothetical protein
VDRLQSCRGHRAASVTFHMTSAGRVSILERSHGSHLMERTIWEGVCVCEEGSAIGHSSRMMCHSRTRNDPLATKLLCQRICRKGHCAISMCNSRGDLAKAHGGLGGGITAVIRITYRDRQVHCFGPILQITSGQPVMT